VSTQLRLVETLPPAPSTGNKSRKRSGQQPRKAAGTVGPVRGSSKQALTKQARTKQVNWGDWRLDTRTRTVGRAGVAAARRALQDATASEQLSEAS
jgi:hypothetical protein